MASLLERLRQNIRTIKTPGRNAPCPCKSGRKFKKCCLRFSEEQSAGPRKYERYTLRNLVLEEISAFKKIFEVKVTERSITVKDDISDSDVLYFCEKVFNIWESKRDLVSCLPTAEDLKYRAIHFADPDMFTTVNLIARYCLYCDQIITIDPFGFIREFGHSHEASPFRKPEEWIRQIILDGIYLCSLEEWIKADLVIVTAFPLGFDHPERRKHIEMAQTRIKKLPQEDWRNLVEESFEQEFMKNFTPQELDSLEKPSREGSRLIREILEDEKLLAQMNRTLPGITKEYLSNELADAERRRGQIQRAKRFLASEPRRYHWAVKQQFKNTIIKTGPGMNLEDAVWLANVTGSHLVTDRRSLWNDIVTYEPQEPPPDAPPTVVKQSLTTPAEAFQRLQFRFLNDVPLDFALKLRQEGRLASFRQYLRDFWNKVRKLGLSEAERLAAIQEFQDGLATEYEKFKKEFQEIEKLVYQRTAVGGIGGAGAIISGNLALAIPSIGLLVTALDHEAKKGIHRVNALSVFLDLERR